MMSDWTWLLGLILSTITCIFVGGGFYFITKGNNRKMEDVIININTMQLENIKFNTKVNTTLDIVQKDFSSFRSEFSEFRGEMRNLEHDVTNIRANANLNAELLNRLERDTDRKITDLQKKVG